MDHILWNKIFLENWMSLLSQKIKQKRLRELLIPGAHDANTYTIPTTRVGSEFARCQNISTEDQAKLGVRFFDLRYGSGKDEYEVLDHHGPFAGEDFFSHFEQLRKFSNTHKDEFFIISIQAETKVHVKARKRAIRKICGILNGKLIDKNDAYTWFRLETVTLEEIFMREKRFFVFARDELFEDTGFTDKQLRKAGIFSQKDCIVSKWHDVGDERLLLQKNIEELKSKDNFPDKLFCSQFVLTLQRDPKSILTSIFTMDMPTIVNFVEKLYQSSKLPHFVSMNIEKPFNIMLFDHVHYDLSLMELIVSANSLEEIQVHKVYVGEKDLTEEFQSRIRNKKVLYIYNLQRVFKRFKPAFEQICVIYSLGDGPYRVRISSPKERSMIIYSNIILKEKEDIIQGYVLWVKQDRFKCKTITTHKSDQEIKEICKNTKQQSVILVRDNLIYKYQFKI